MQTAPHDRLALLRSRRSPNSVWLARMSQEQFHFLETDELSQVPGHHAEEMKSKNNHPKASPGKHPDSDRMKLPTDDKVSSGQNAVVSPSH